MAFTPDFTVSQTAGLPSIINFIDSSVGTDATIFSRRIYIQRNNGVYLIPQGNNTNYILWNYTSPTTTVNVLNKDYAVTIRVDWLDVGGNVLYTKTRIVLFQSYLKAFFYSLTQYQAANISITQNTNFYGNKSKLWGFIVGSQQAIELATDISGAQNELDAGTNMITNEKLFF